MARTLVDPHATSFSFDAMDGIDQVIFAIGLAEFHELKTPYQIVLNEMVELAKRYGDESSPTLIN
jgi:transcription termination factor NusB